MEANLFSNTRIEAYVRVSFCGSQAITSVVCVRGRARLAPEFNEELWLPVTEPTETRRISVGLWNYSSHTRDRPIAHLYFDLDDIERSSKYISGSFLGGGLLEQNNYMGPRPRWYNLYGAPIRIQGKRGALQNRYGNEASTYRGRLLLSMPHIGVCQVSSACSCGDGLRDTTISFPSHRELYQNAFGDFYRCGCNFCCRLHCALQVIIRLLMLGSQTSAVL